MSTFTRRSFVTQGGLGMLTFYVGGCEVELTPRQARASGAATRMLTAAEVASLEALGETLLPGSRSAGIAAFVDHQLAQPLASQMLMIKYLGVEPPFSSFYRDGLAALDRAARAADRVSFDALDPDARHDLVGQIMRENPPDWGAGPPAPLFGFVVRNDALDVTYGTMEGFEALGIPYMAHIEPPSPWGE